MEVMGQIYHWYFQRITTCFPQAENSDKDTAVCFELIIPQRNADSRLALGWEASQEHLWLQSDNHIPLSLSCTYLLDALLVQLPPRGGKAASTEAQKHPPHLPLPSFPSVRQRVEKHLRGYGKQFWGGYSLKEL